MPLVPWWKEIPGRLEWEFDWLTHEGFRYEEIHRDDASGTIEIRVEYPTGGRVLNLHVIFPPFFPDARYEVRCSELKLIHHQNPFSGELCLLGRSSALWDPAIPLAIFLKEQMPYLLKAGMTEDLSEAGPIEDNQAEPATPFLSFLEDSVLFIHETAETGSKSSGEFDALVKLTGAGEHPAIRGIVRSLDGKTLWTHVAGWRSGMVCTRMALAPELQNPELYPRVRDSDFRSLILFPRSETYSANTLAFPALPNSAGTKPVACRAIPSSVLPTGFSAHPAAIVDVNLILGDMYSLAPSTSVVRAKSVGGANSITVSNSPWKAVNLT